MWEQLWPELDIILKDEGDANSTSTQCTAVILEYHVVVHDHGTKTYDDVHASMANGNAVYDIHHPCRVNIAVQREIHTPESDRSHTHLEFNISSTSITMMLYSLQPPLGSSLQQPFRGPCTLRTALARRSVKSSSKGHSGCVSCSCN